VRKHYGCVWLRDAAQHDVVDEVAKMIAACPGPDGAAPMIRMPDQLESSIQRQSISERSVSSSRRCETAIRRSKPRGIRVPRRLPPELGRGLAGTVWAKVPGGYQNTFNDNMLVAVMIETLDGIINIDEIANTFGIDLW
jgi:hypothetical protein